MPAMQPITSEILDYQEVMRAYDRMLDWLAQTYFDALNVIHQMHLPVRL
jgi:formate C-acetyltransferase